MVIEVEVNLQACRVWINSDQLIEAVRLVLASEGFCRGSVSLAVVDDPTIHQLNRRHLEHDYPTDVLSFVWDRDADRLEGEIIVSADTAQAAAAEYGWSPAAELLLYVVHGSLHLVGYDDKSPAERDAMRAKEAEYLGRFGLVPPEVVELDAAADREGGSSP